MSPTGAPRPGVMIVMTDISPEEEARFNHWYDTEHVPERVEIPGVRLARRFVRDDGAPQPAPGTVAAQRGPQYLVIYELDDLAILDGDWAELTTEPSELSRALYPHMTNLTREVFELIGTFEEPERVDADATAVDGQAGAGAGPAGEATGEGSSEGEGEGRG